MDNRSLDPSQNNLQKGKDMTDAEAHVLKKEYNEMKKTYHMALDMIESEKIKNSKLRAEVMELKYQKKPSEEAA
tara:strand:+ start:32 stop:253 length:222 start_codon:yes stop_codon:yes gene_type:complete